MHPEIQDQAPKLSVLDPESKDMYHCHPSHFSEIYKPPVNALIRSSQIQHLKHTHQLVNWVAMILFMLQAILKSNISKLIESVDNSHILDGTHIFQVRFFFSECNWIAIETKPLPCKPQFMKSLQVIQSSFPSGSLVSCRPQKCALSLQCYKPVLGN